MKRVSKSTVVLQIAFLYAITICSISFYHFAFLGKLSKVFHLLGIVLIVALLLIHIAYEKVKISSQYSLFIWIILFSLPLSMISAYAFHDQGFSLTAYGQRKIYYYLLYFLLPLLKPRTKDVYRLIFVFAFIYMTIYFLQYFIYPNKILDVLIKVNRGTVRIYMEGLAFVIIAYFIALQEFLRKKKVNFFIFCMLTIVLLILNGSRLLILTVVFVTLLNILISKQVKSKGLIYFLITLSIITIFYFFREIFEQYIEATEKTKQIGAENVRIRAALYFLTELFPNKWSYILGNGAPNIRSSYGRTIELLRNVYHFNISDVGIIGNYVYYGIFFVLGVLLLLSKGIFSRYATDFSYLKYLFIQFAMSLTAVGFMNSDFIVPLCFCLYLADISKYETLKEEKQLKLENIYNE